MMRARSVAGVLAVALGISPLGAQTFKTRVDGVTVDVSVTNGNRVITGLGRDDFELTDNGVRQKVLEVGREELPLDLTLVADLGGGGVLHSSVLAGVDRVRKALRETDRLKIITFERRVEDLGAFAAPASQPALPFSDRRDAFAAGESVLFDAIAAALEVPREVGRRSLTLVFSAGRDTGSRSSAQVLELSRRADTAIFVVHARLNYAPTERPPDSASALPVPVVPSSVPQRFYRDIAEITGGTVQLVEPLTVLRNDTERRSMRVRLGDDGLSQAFLRAIDDFRSSYVLRYTPTDVPEAEWHEIKVRVVKAGRYNVRARRGYASK